MKEQYHKLKILLVTDVMVHVSDYAEVLEVAGHSLVARKLDDGRLLKIFDQEKPDVLVLDIDSPDPELFGTLKVINSCSPCPVVMFSGDDNRVFIELAIKANISSYVVRGYLPKRIIPVIETAILRFNQNHAMQTELIETREKLEERKVIEKAKGIVMKKSAVDEATAYKTLRDMAMKRNMKLSDVSKSIITASEVLI